MFDQALAPFAQLGSVLRIACQVVQVVRVAVEMEELLFAVDGVEDVLPAAIRHRIPVVLRAVADVVLQIDELAPTVASFGAAFADQREQAAAVDWPGHCGTGGIEKSRQHIAEFYRLRHYG